MRTAVVIMTKIPVPGYAKTRMMPEMTADECAEFHRACLTDICRTVKKTGYPGFLYYVSQCIDRVTLDNRNLLGVDEYILDYFVMKPQKGDDLGQRMLEAIREVLIDFNAVIVIGGDIPELTASLLLEASQRLHDFDVVLGPAIDGGYYLIAMTKPYNEIFADVPWGTGHVLGITLEKLRKGKKTYSLLPELHDIDTWEDIKLYNQRGGKDSINMASYQLAEKIINQ